MFMRVQARTMDPSASSYTGGQDGPKNPRAQSDLGTQSSFLFLAFISWSTILEENFDFTSGQNKSKNTCPPQKKAK